MRRYGHDHHRARHRFLASAWRRLIRLGACLCLAAAQDTQPAGCIKLKDAKVTFPIPPNINVGTSVKRDHCFELFSSGSPSFASH